MLRVAAIISGVSLFPGGESESRPGDKRDRGTSRELMMIDPYPRFLSWLSEAGQLEGQQAVKKAAVKFRLKG